MKVADLPNIMWNGKLIIFGKPQALGPADSTQARQHQPRLATGMTDKSCKLLEANSLSKCPCHSTVAVNLAARMTVCKLQYAVLRYALRSVFRQVTFNLNELTMSVPIRGDPTWPAEAVNATPLAKPPWLQNGPYMQTPAPTTHR